MQSLARFDWRAALLVAALCVAAPAHATPRTAWGRFPLASLPTNTPVAVRTAGGTTFDVTVTTGGTQGVYGANLGDTLGVAESGLNYDSLYVTSIFNGGGLSRVPTSITFSNVQPGPAHGRGLLLLGDISGLSSPVTVTSSVAGRVATWSVVGVPFARGADSIAVQWTAGSGTFTIANVVGADSRCVVLDLGDLGGDGTINVSLDQHLNDGIVFSLGEELTGTLGVPAPANPALALSPPRPNPAHGAATLDFTLPASGHVRMVAYDLAGRRLATLADAEFAAGAHAFRWDLRDAAGAGVPAGLVFVRLETAAGTRTRRLLVTR
jgi:hypothetical protein